MTLLEQCPVCDTPLGRDDQYRCPDQDCGADLASSGSRKSGRDGR